MVDLNSRLRDLDAFLVNGKPLKLPYLFIYLLNLFIKFILVTLVNMNIQVSGPSFYAIRSV